MAVNVVPAVANATPTFTSTHMHTSGSESRDVDASAKDKGIDAFTADLIDIKREEDGRVRLQTHRIFVQRDRIQQEIRFKAKEDLQTMCRNLWNWKTQNPKGYDA
ncbi:hypothetical protein C2E23DRAFT_894092 [Lenzites betulinus]|nr:hypothetical protein C2E23DRAFT_894092 [Lenzites betulinus]